MRKLLSVTLTLVLMLGLTANALAGPNVPPANKVETTNDRATAFEIFGDLPVVLNPSGGATYGGAATITIMASGWITVQPIGQADEAEKERGFAIYVNRKTPNQILYNEGGVMTVKPAGSSPGTPFLTLNGGTPDYSLTGALTLTYNEKTGELNLALNAGDANFNENFVFAPPGDPTPVPPSSCRCTYSVPSNPRYCTAEQNACPPGMYAKCTCNSNGCTATCLPVPKGVVAAT
ncbi:MAG: hypothetical protein AAB364_01440 [Patescibacteria group bacterium]